MNPLIQLKTSPPLLVTLALLCFGLSSGAAPNRRQALRTFPRALVGTPVFHPLQLMNANKGVLGFNLGHLWDETELLRNALHDVVEMWSTGVIEPVIDSTYPLSEVPEAIRHLEEGHARGKVVITV